MSRLCPTPELPNDYREGVPLTALTVTPGVQTEPLSIGLSGRLNVGVTVKGFGAFNFKVEVFRVAKNLGIDPKPEWWPENNRLRLTTMQSFLGNVESNVTSHLPDDPIIRRLKTRHRVAGRSRIRPRRISPVAPTALPQRNAG